MRCPTLDELPSPPAGRVGWPWTEASPTVPATRVDGSSWPRVSIVTPAYNQAHYLEETIRSVLLQGYPDLEYIIIDDGSTDNTVEVIRKYEPWLAHWTTQPNQGQCAAINHGFEHVTGQIQAYLNSDDLLLPGALERVAQEIDPSKGKHVVMGRCRFTDSAGHYIGIEHPSYFESHRRVLEVWKGHTIPQPAVFWTPEVWKTCGPVIEDLGPAWVDYGLFCRFSKRFTFHPVDHVLATYRLHAESKTQLSAEKQRLDESIKISRSYWGTPFSVMYWRLALSLAWYRFNRVGRARNWLKQAQEANRHGQKWQAAPYAIAGSILAPEVVFYAGIYPSLRNQGTGLFNRLLQWLVRRQKTFPQTEAYIGRTDPWEDGWIGPQLLITREIASKAHTIVVQGWVDLKYLKPPLLLTVEVDDKEIGRPYLAKSGDFSLRLPLSSPLPPGLHSIEIKTNTWFVPHRFTGNNDFRPLAWRMLDISLQ